MARHTKVNAQSKHGWLKWLIAALLIVVIAAGGVFAYFRFIVQPDTDPPAPDESAAHVTEAQAPTDADISPSVAEKVEAYLAGMSEREKLCQLFIATPESITGVSTVVMAGDATRDALERYPVGGLIYFSQNLIDAEQTRTMIENSQSYAKTPLFVSVDEEGGIVARCAEKLGTAALDNMYTYRHDGVETAYNNAGTIARDISALGFNLDFAPVADVWTNPDNTVIAERAYSDNYEQAAELVGAAVRGFNENGVLATLKHFPGHGDTLEDSHLGLAYLDKTAEELRSGELLPFRSGIDAGAEMVMIGHLVVGAMDEEYPATLSPVVVPTLLREGLGYDGVTVTDGMNMQAITDNYSYAEIVKGIFDADIDMILCPDDIDSYLEAMETALADGTITEEQLDRKLTRILTLKFERGILY